MTTSTDKLKFQVIICSTRPGRIGTAIGRWFHEATVAAGSPFEIELVDLADVALPLLDEPKHPRLGQYQHEHTWRWAETVSRAQAFAFVTPEYNYAPPPSLLNALDYLHTEWAYKPVGFVSYGGISGGTRAVQVTKQVVTTLRMVPLQEAVVIPNPFGGQLAEGKFTPTQVQADAIAPMLAEAHKLASALQLLQAAPVAARAA